MTDMSGDFAAIKIFGVGKHWIAQYSGADVSYVPAIVREVKATSGDSLASVCKAFRGAFQHQLRLKIENGILAPLGYTLEDFRKNGLSQLGAEQFAQMLFEVKSQKLDLEFLVSGFEENQANIFVVHSNGAIADYSELGFWAIGTGQTMALGFLFNLKRRPRFLDETTTFYRVCEAKFNAENAEGVGEQTLTGILYSDGQRTTIPLGDAKELRTLWQATAANDPPSNIRRKTEEILAQAKKRTFGEELKSSGSKTSKSAP